MDEEKEEVIEKNPQQHTIKREREGEKKEGNGIIIKLFIIEKKKTMTNLFNYYSKLSLFLIFFDSNLSFSSHNDFFLSKKIRIPWKEKIGEKKRL